MSTSEDAVHTLQFLDHFTRRLESLPDSVTLRIRDQVQARSAGEIPEEHKDAASLALGMATCVVVFSLVAAQEVLRALPEFPLSAEDRADIEQALAAYDHALETGDLSGLPDHQRVTAVIVAARGETVADVLGRVVG